MAIVSAEPLAIERIGIGNYTINMCSIKARAGSCLLARSWFSLLSGCVSPSDVVRHAIAAGYGSAAVIDRNALYGLPEFIEQSRGTGLKVMAGATLSDCQGNDCTAFALEKKGYARLCTVISRIKYDEYDVGHGKPSSYSLKADLCEAGYDGLAIASRDRGFLDALSSFRGGALFCALPYGEPFRAARDYASSRGMRILAVHETVFFEPCHRKRYELLRAVDLRVTLDAVKAACERETALSPRVRVPARGWNSATPGELESFYSAVPEALASLAWLAETAEDAESFFSRPPVFPPYEGHDSRETLGLLESECRKGIARRYGTSRPDIEERLGRELDIIGRKGFAPYFLTVRDIVSTCPRTCGRGSGASSIVAYLLGITHVEPLSLDLFFERFLNEGREDPPDIDVDFPWDERESVLLGVFEKWKGRAGMVADHCTFSRRGSLREAGLALGLPPEEIERCHLLERLGETGGIPEALSRARSLLWGVPRYIGTHPGGVVIVPDSITDYVPIQPSPSGLPVISFEKDGTEYSGLVKIDLLGNRSLGVLRDASSYLNRDLPEDKKINWESFDPRDEPVAKAMIEKGDTLGVFYVESPATRLLLRKMGSGDYAHLVVASSIIRPAANKLINEYVRRLHGGEWKRLHPAAEEALRETLGIMVYQEDVSRVAIAAAGFDPGEADALRKTISKKKKSEKLAMFKELFLSGCRVRGVTNVDAETLWEMMQSFDGYSFCKAHSASYALVSYRLAWIKSRRPLVFFAEVINNGGGFYSRQSYLNEVRRLGFAILPPSVQKSDTRYRIETVDSSLETARFQAEVPGIHGLRTPLVQLKGLSVSCVERIVKSREERGPFGSFADFVLRVAPSRDDVRPLVFSGALDGLPLFAAGERPLTRPELFWAHHAFSLRSPDADLFPDMRIPTGLGDYTARVALKAEAESLGLIITVHPSAYFVGRAEAAAKTNAFPPLIDASTLADHVGKRVSLCGIPAAAKEAVTSTREKMSFFSFEDATGFFETVFFPQAYTRFLPILESRTAFLVVGTVVSDCGALSVEVDGLVGLSRTA